MKLISIIGPVEDFDRIAQDYLLQFDMHIENAATLLDNVRGLVPFADEGSGGDSLSKIREYFNLARLDPESLSPPSSGAEPELPPEEINARLQEIDALLTESHEQLSQNEAARKENEQMIRQLSHMLSLDADLDAIFKLSFIKFRFGRLPKSGYQKLKMYLQDI
ncbi:MAG: hypothetical protein ACI4QW_06560, partial [Clostridia bacterium]